MECCGIFVFAYDLVLEVNFEFFWKISYRWSHCVWHWGTQIQCHIIPALRELAAWLKVTNMQKFKEML